MADFVFEVGQRYMTVTGDTVRVIMVESFGAYVADFMGIAHGVSNDGTDDGCKPFISHISAQWQQTLDAIKVLTRGGIICGSFDPDKQKLVVAPKTIALNKRAM
jgi:hypothetical protein